MFDDGSKYQEKKITPEFPAMQEFLDDVLIGNGYDDTFRRNSLLYLRMSEGHLPAPLKEKQIRP